MSKGGINPKVKDVLKLLGVGTIITVSVLFPGVAVAGNVILKEYQRYKWEKDKKEWEKFNQPRLRQILKRLEKQKTVEFLPNGAISITEKGKRKLLKYDLENIKLSRTTDGQWRIIMYDISEMKRWQRDIFRRFLKNLKFLKIQKSVYLTPFQCENEIEYLRQTFGVGAEVTIIKASGIENEEAYRKYFGL